MPEIMGWNAQKYEVGDIAYIPIRITSISNNQLHHLITMTCQTHLPDSAGVHLTINNVHPCHLSKK